MHSKLLSYFVRMNKTHCQSNLPEASAQSQNKFVSSSVRSVCEAHEDAIWTRMHTHTNRSSSIRRACSHIPTLLIGSEPNELLILSWSKRMHSHPDVGIAVMYVFVYFLHEVLANVATGKGRRQNFWLALAHQYTSTYTHTHSHT